MAVPNGAPLAVSNQLAGMPQQNVGEFYAKIKPPFWPFAKWYHVPVWGQVCDGRHNHGVGCFLHNEFPGRGKGWTYLEWMTKPLHPDLCAYPTSGKVPNPAPFDPDQDVYKY
jgi:hypothetical protein